MGEAGKGIDEGGAVGIGVDVMRAFFAGDARWFAAFEADGIELGFERAGFRRGEVDQLSGFVDGGQVANFPIAGSDLVQQFSVSGIAIDVAEAGPFAGPEKAIFQGVEVVGEVDPGSGFLAEDEAGLAGLGVAEEEFEFVLEAREAFDGEGFGIGEPDDAGEE